MEINGALLTMCIFYKWAVLGQQVESFYEATELRSMLTDEQVLKTIDLSEINMLCGRLCSIDSSCVSFFENSVSRQCRLIDNKLNVSQMCLTGVQGWQYYVSAPVCPESHGYIHNVSLGLCYKYVDMDLQIPEARAFCESEGGQLLQIKSAEEHAVIANYLNTISASENPSVDGKRSDNNSPFLYYDGTPVTYFDWGQGQPKANIQCLKIIVQYGCKMYNAYCTRTKPFLCQILV